MSWLQHIINMLWNWDCDPVLTEFNLLQQYAAFQEGWF